MPPMTEPQDKETSAKPNIIHQANTLEREAHRLRAEGHIDQAFQTFDHAAKLFQKAEEHLKSAMCYASAATCWNIHTGWQPLKNAATRSELAAIQAYEARDYVYAETLFNDAAMLYEKEGNFSKYSQCYERAKNVQLKYLWNAAFHPDEKGRSLHAHTAAGSPPKKFELLLRYWMGFTSSVIWGHGERPFRTFAIACGVIIGCAAIYFFSGLVAGSDLTQKATFGHSLYMSIITYATVGYGDFVPTGWIRIVAAFEALAGITVTPLFLIALARRYLRLSR
jgi:tetratricopeptide (TPR) repeat protein